MMNNFDNVMKTSHEKGLVKCCDGTYKLMIGNWVIINVGATVIIFEVDGSKTDASDQLFFLCAGYYARKKGSLYRPLQNND